MPGKRFGSLAVIFIVTAAVLLIPVLHTGVASAKCSWMNCLSIISQLDSTSDYRWIGDWDPRFDREMQTHYCGINPNDCNVRCELQYSCQTCSVR